MKKQQNNKTIKNKKNPKKKSKFKFTTIREYSAGGLVYRTRENGSVDFLLIQDKRGRWSIPKGHMEDGETKVETAIREITEETSLQSLRNITELDPVYFFYKIEGKLVHMTVFVFLIEAMRGYKEAVKTEEIEWITDVRWFNIKEAYDKLEYPDLKRLLDNAYNIIISGEEVINNA